jgi:hypothetical protein
MFTRTTYDTAAVFTRAVLPLGGVGVESTVETGGTALAGPRDLALTSVQGGARRPLTLHVTAVTRTLRARVRRHKHGPRHVDTVLVLTTRWNIYKQ